MLSWILNISAAWTFHKRRLLFINSCQLFSTPLGMFYKVIFMLVDTDLLSALSHKYLGKYEVMLLIYIHIDFILFSMKILSLSTQQLTWKYHCNNLLYETQNSWSHFRMNSEFYFFSFWEIVELQLQFAFITKWIISHKLFRKLFLTFTNPFRWSYFRWLTL